MQANSARETLTAGPRGRSQQLHVMVCTLASCFSGLASGSHLPSPVWSTAERVAGHLAVAVCLAFWLSSRSSLSSCTLNAQQPRRCLLPRSEDHGLNWARRWGSALNPFGARRSSDALPTVSYGSGDFAGGGWGRGRTASAELQHHEDGDMSPRHGGSPLMAAASVSAATHPRASL